MRSSVSTKKNCPVWFERLKLFCAASVTESNIYYTCSSIFHAVPILNSCMKYRCGFLFVRHKRHCCTELVSWEHAACPLSGIKKRPLVGGWLNTSSIVISIGATASVHYREVVRSWEGPLWEVPLYTYCAGDWYIYPRQIMK